MTEDDVKAWYASNKETLEHDRERYASKLRDILLNDDSFTLADSPIISRVKTKESLVEKVIYRKRSVVKETSDIKNKISDLVGLRVIAIYQDEIPRIVEKISRNFLVLKTEDKGVFHLDKKTFSRYDKLIRRKFEVLSEDEKSITIALKYGYQGFHIDVFYSESGESDVSFRAEIQIHSLIHDAWFQLDHKLKYKKRIIPSLEAEINSLTMPFNFAEKEFIRLRDVINSVESFYHRGPVIPHSVVEEIISPNILTTSDIFIFLKDYFGKAALTDGTKLQKLFDIILKCDSRISRETLEKAFKTYFSRVNDYEKHAREIERDFTEMTPFMKTRYILYAFDSRKFDMLLLPESKRKSFNEYLASTVKC